MQELFNAAFSAVNFFPTLLLLVIIVYWLSVIIGALDLDFLNIDFDADVEVDADLDVDVDAEGEVSTETSTEGVLVSLNSILAFFNLGKVPFMILMSFFILPLWMISIMSNHLLLNESFLFSLLLLIPNIIVSLLVSKVLTTPFAMLYTRMSKNKEDGFEYSGKMCTIIIPANHARIGQAEIHHNGNTFRINVLTHEGVALDKGQSGLIINYIENKKCYLVEPYKI